MNQLIYWYKKIKLKLLKYNMDIPFQRHCYICDTLIINIGWNDLEKDLKKTIEKNFISRLYIIMDIIDSTGHNGIEYNEDPFYICRDCCMELSEQIKLLKQKHLYSS